MRLLASLEILGSSKDGWNVMQMPNYLLSVTLSKQFSTFALHLPHTLLFDAIDTAVICHLHCSLSLDKALAASTSAKIL